MDREERVGTIYDRSEQAIKRLRQMRSQARKGKHIDPSDFSELAEVIASLRHHCELFNDERVTQK